MISACGSSSNNLVEGNTQVRVEYFGEMQVNTCYPNLTCRIRSNSECVSMLYKEVKKSTQNGLLAIRGKDYAKADEIRNLLKEKGIELIDQSKEITTWIRV